MLNSPDDTEPSRSSGIPLRLRWLSNLPIIFLVTSLLLTLFLWQMYDKSLLERARYIFADRIDHISSSITQRMLDQQQMLRGAAALISIKDDVSRADWRQYVAGLRLAEKHPGLQGISFSKLLTPAEKEAHIRKIRAEGFPRYTIHPAGDRPAYSPVIYIEPFEWRNQRAFGYDNYAEPVRRAAMEKARDENITTVAAKVVLSQENGTGQQSGYVMFVPVYRKGIKLDTVAKRRAACIGFVASVVRMNNFVSAVIPTSPQDIAFDITVGADIAGKPTVDNLMYSSIQADKIVLPEKYTPAITSTETVEAYGCSWQYTFKTLPAFTKESNRTQSYLFLLAGILFSVGVSYLIKVQLKSRDKTIKVSEENILLLNNRLALAADSAAFSVWEWLIPENKLVWDKRMFTLYGIREEDSSGAYDVWRNGVHPDDRERGDSGLKLALRGEKKIDDEFRIVWPSGEVRHLRVTAKVLHAADGKPLRMIGVNYDITEQKLAEQKRKESEEMLNLILNSAAEAIYGIDMDGLCTFCNQALLDVLGYDSMDELLGKNMHDVAHHTFPDGSHFPVHECKIFKAFQFGLGSHVDDEFFWRKDGSSFPAEYWSYPQHKNGEIVGAVITFFDITERKSAEQRVRDAQEFTRSTIDGLSAHICVVNADGEIITTNSAWDSYAITNNAAEGLGKSANYLDACLNASKEGKAEAMLFHAGISAVLHGALPVFVREYPCHSPDMERWFTCRVNPFIINGARYAVISHENITERKQADDELRKLSLAVRQSPVSIMITDTQGVIEFVNPAFSMITGYSAEEAIGQNPRVLKSGLTPPEMYKELWLALTSGNTWEGEWLNKKKDGRLFWEHCNISVIRNEPGVITHYLASKTDITERKQLEEQLKATHFDLELIAHNRMKELIIIREQKLELAKINRHLEEVSRIKSDFLANMSHELRTPLNSIIGFSDVLQRQHYGVINEKQSKYVSYLTSSGKHLLTLIDNILDLSKVESGKMSLTVSDFLLRNVLNDSLNLLRAKADEGEVSLQLKLDPEADVHILADMTKLTQIISNLLSNAIKFTPAGGTVEMSVVRDAQCFEFRVTDSGIGIKEEDITKLFQPFTQLESSYTKKFQGTGLGLALSRQLVEMHGGKIWVESEFGTGSRFVFTIPQKQNFVEAPSGGLQLFADDYDNNSGELPTESSVNTSIKTAAIPHRILITEDNEANLDLLKSLLLRCGYEVFTAENGQYAVALALEVRPELILMDIQMPVVDGMKAFELLRGYPETSGIKIIAITAYAMLGDREKFLGAGFDGYISKPIDASELLSQIRQMLDANL